MRQFFVKNTTVQTYAGHGRLHRPLHNITTKTLTIVEPDQVPPGFLGKIKNFMKRLFRFNNPDEELNVNVQAQGDENESINELQNDVQDDENESKKDK